MCSRCGIECIATKANTFSAVALASAAPAACIDGYGPGTVIHVSIYICAASPTNTQHPLVQCNRYTSRPVCAIAAHGAATRRMPSASSYF